MLNLASLFLPRGLFRRPRRWPRPGAVLLAFALVAAARAAPEGAGSISGTVLRPTGGASVDGLSVALEENPQATKTDRYGRFSLGGLAPGTYTLVVTGAGYPPLKIRHVLVQAATDTALNEEEMPALAAGGEVTIEAKRKSDVEVIAKYVVSDVKPFTDENVDMVRTMDDAQPYFIFDHNTIENTGAEDVEDFLKQRLPMDATVQTNIEVNNARAGATSSIGLLGLGANQTLVLIDGRRAASVTVPPGIGQPDLNGVPLAAIDHIEVLPTSAAGIYGGSAVGGVINVVLKRDYTGGDVLVRYQNTMKSDDPIRSVDLNYGISAEDGKTWITFSGHYSDEKVLLNQDRPGLVYGGLNRILQTVPALLYTNVNPYRGSTPNLGAATNLVLKAAYGGTALNSPITYIPGGFSATSNPSALVANAGKFNFDLPPTNQFYNGEDLLIGSAPRIKTFRIAFRREMSKHLEIYADFVDASNIVPGQIGLSAGPYSVPATAPDNPFQQAVFVNLPANVPLNPYAVDNLNHGATFGFTYKLPLDWSLAADYNWNYNSLNSVAGTRDSVDLTKDLASGVLNPFVDTLAHPLNFAPYYGVQRINNNSTQNETELRLSGPVWHLPGGAPNASLGIDHRKEGYQNGAQVINYVDPANSTATLFPGQSQTINSAYGEVEVPIFGAPNALPGVQSLELQLAARSEKFSVGAGTSTINLLAPTPIVHATADYDSTSPIVGLTYKPVKGVMLRGSYSTAFLPPTYAQLAPNPLATQTTVVDPLRGNASASTMTISGGNPALNPEKSKSKTAGIVFEPEAIRGLRLALDYYDIEKTDQITTLGVQNVVTNVAQGLLPAGLVTRAPLTATDQSLGYTGGAITLVNNSNLNLTKAMTEGFDLTTEYRTQPTAFGTFDVMALATVVNHFRRQTTFNAPYAEYLNFVAQGGVDKWRANASFTWNFQHWTFVWNAAYYGSYLQDGAPGNPTGPTTTTQYLQAQGGNSIPSQIYHDLVVSYRWSRAPHADSWILAILSDTTVQVGVKNLFNQNPPFDAFYSPYYYSPFGDARLREYWISVRRQF